MNDYLFEARNLSYTVESILNIGMETTEYSLLEKINFRLKKNEIIGIVGQNGAGKSTLCRLLSGIEPPTEGEIFLENKNVIDYSPQWKIHQDIAMVFQNIEEQFIGKTCMEDTGLYLSNFGYSESEIEERLWEAAKELHVETLLDSSLAELSGGQKQLLAISEVLALKPKVMILDEPTAQLDEVNEAIVLDQLKKVVEKAQVSIILVSHKISELKYTDYILGLENKTVQHSFSSEYFLTQYDLLTYYNLTPPATVEITHYLQNSGIPVTALPDLSIDSFIGNIRSFFKNGGS